VCEGDLMKLIAIEPTPSPNSMKLIVNEKLPNGKNMNLTKGFQGEAPVELKQLLEVEGVKSLYYVSDFIALDRNPKFDWKPILSRAREIFGEEKNEENVNQETAKISDFGEVKVFIQKFRSIPMQVKLMSGDEEFRFGLPPRFMQAIMDAQASTNNVVMERQWIEQSPRYGEVEQIGDEVVEELNAAYSEERLNFLVKKAFDTSETHTPDKKFGSYKVTMKMLEESDWKKRYAALEQMDPTMEDLPVLEKALIDEKASIRRLATVYLGMLEEKAVIPLLEKAIHDKSVTVRRTAGDCFSDLGFTDAMPIMIEALKDPNKLVRWRAAMFLYEVGDEQAIPGLNAAQNDPEFEVALQVKMALQRIEGGDEAKGSVWKQMTETFNNTNNKTGGK
jgi:hypothetical protein